MQTSSFTTSSALCLYDLSLQSLSETAGAITSVLPELRSAVDALGLTGVSFFRSLNILSVSLASPPFLEDFQAPEFSVPDASQVVEAFESFLRLKMEDLQQLNRSLGNWKDSVEANLRTQLAP